VENGDQFGSALAAEDFNHDGFVDLAAGAPGEAVGSAGGAGAVSVLPGSAAGLTAAGGQLFPQVGARSRAVTSSGLRWRLGTSTTTGSRIWPPPLRSRTSAAPWMRAWSACSQARPGLTASGARLFTQNSPGVLGTAKTFDLFGGLEIVF
jgi:hypothetical protein